MSSSSLAENDCTPLHQNHDHPCAWIELQNEAEFNCVAAELFEKLAERRCPPDAQKAIRTALESAVFHALRHGSRVNACSLDPDCTDEKGKVRLYFYLSDKYLIATIKNLGTAALSPLPDHPAQSAQENLTYEADLFLMRRSMTWVRFNGLENSVTMCKSWYGARS